MKGSQGNLRKNVQQLFECAKEINFVGIEHSFYQTTHSNQGRIELDTTGSPRGEGSSSLTAA